MKCRNAMGMLQRYIDNSLETADRKLLEQHLAGCKSCRNELKLIGRLRTERERQKEFRAPEGFTDNVMAAIYRLPPEKRPVREEAREERWRLVYRRLGYSLILTAGIILFSLLVPVAGIHPDSISGRVQNSVESSESGYRDVLTDIDNGIMGIFKSRGNQGSDIKGGIENGM